MNTNTTPKGAYPETNNEIRARELERLLRDAEPTLPNLTALAMAAGKSPSPELRAAIEKMAARLAEGNGHFTAAHFLSAAQCSADRAANLPRRGKVIRTMLAWLLLAFLPSDCVASPYDRYMGPVREVNAQLSSRAVTFGEVEAAMKVVKRLRYSFDSSNPWKPTTPAETRRRGTGDCKAKALLLLSMLGSRDAVFCIGKTYAGAKMNHAWLEWTDGGTTWILDATFFSMPLDKKSSTGSRYVTLVRYPSR